MLNRFFGFKNVPLGLRIVYRGCIKKHLMLKNGWEAVVLTNGLLHMYRGKEQPILVGGFKQLSESTDGKFMIARDNGYFAIFDAEGIRIANFKPENRLFANGWYRVKTEDGVTLFNTKGDVVRSKLVNAKVFEDGRYILLFNDRALFFAPNGTLIATCKDDVRVLWNGWYIADNVLYDNQNNHYLRSRVCRGVDQAVLQCVGMLMPKKH